MTLIDLKDIVKSSVFPPGGPLLIAALGLLLAGRWPRTGRAIAALGVLLVWLGSTPAVGYSLMVPLEAGLSPLTPSVYEAVRSGPNPPGAVVVLGTGIRPDGLYEPRTQRPTTLTQERLQAAARTARITGLPILVAAGTPGPGQPSQTELMREVLQTQFGATVRWAEERAFDTDDNARFVAERLGREGIRSIVLVTHAYHMQRARRVFERAGLEVVVAPHNFRAAWPDWGWRAWRPSADGIENSALALQELATVPFYRWLDRTDPPGVPPGRPAR
jgi:uncharacterized SAM-binding protein YcdF (DUF218 family)